MYEIDEAREELEIQAKYYELIAACRDLKPLTADEEAGILRAYRMAKSAHAGTRRKSGEPYIFHPLAVALIAVKEVGLGPIAVISALLHDVVEDTDITLDELRMVFGERVATIVDGVTKIDDVMVIQQAESKQAENYRKILLSMCNDAYVIFLKLCDRLHNMRTLDSMKDTKKLIIASETSYLYIPLAHRLGLYKIKTELEDLVMRYTNPDKYAEIAAKIAATADIGEQLKECLYEPVKQMLDQAGYNYTVKTRVKSVYSCWKKIENKHVDFNEIYDLYAMRIVLHGVPREHEKEECFRIYAMISGSFDPNPNRFRDWITHPKNNGYEALHCTVISNSGSWVEVQIRSRRMDDIAEKGIAAHWAYKKEGFLSNEDNEMDRWLRKIQGILTDPDVSSLELLDLVHEDLSATDIYVFTPNGDQKRIRKDATALDFAYAIHSEIGRKAIAAKVNMRLVPLSQVLHSGDQVEILTTETGEPQREWLKFVRTRRAREDLQDYFRAKDGSGKDAAQDRSVSISFSGISGESLFEGSLDVRAKDEADVEQLMAALGRIPGMGKMKRSENV